MAKPQATARGIDYYPCDVSMMDDEKLAPVIVEFKSAAKAIWIDLLAAVYRQGYFLPCNDELIYKLARANPDISPNAVRCIIAALVKWGLFSKDPYDAHRILTSHGIQLRYFSVTRRRKFPPYKDMPYMLISPKEWGDLRANKYGTAKEDTYLGGKNVNGREQKQGSCMQPDNKGKERKEKEMVGVKDTPTLKQKQKKIKGLSENEMDGATVETDTATERHDDIADFIKAWNKAAQRTHANILQLSPDNLTPKRRELITRFMDGTDAKNRWAFIYGVMTDPFCNGRTTARKKPADLNWVLANPDRISDFIDQGNNLIRRWSQGG